MYPYTTVTGSVPSYRTDTAVPTPPHSSRPEVFIASSDTQDSLRRSVAAGTLRRLARGLYTSNLVAPEQQIVRKNLWSIVAQLVPDALVVDRTAADLGRVGPNGEVFLASETRVRDITLPGHHLAVRRAAALPDDPLWHPDGVHMSSPARALVDNLEPSRARTSRLPRTLRPGEYEDWVAAMAAKYGPAALNRMRDRAREIAIERGLPERAAQIDRVVGATLGTYAIRPRGALLAARHRGAQWDTERLIAFHEIADALGTAERAREWPRSAAAPDAQSHRLLAFFEAYFSNYIEGSDFPLDVAERIVFRHEIPTQRPKDAHDVLGTYEIALEEVESPRVPSRPGDLFPLLAERHRVLMAERPEIGPGQRKLESNRFGSYDFVQPDLVLGTLERAWPLVAGLATPMARALMTMFVVSEVHPFADGNGRVARLAMNAELSAAGECRIVLPIICRNDYLAALRRCSRQHDPVLLVRVLARAQHWTATMHWSDLTVTTRLMDQTNALVDSQEAEELHLYLRSVDEILTPPRADTPASPGELDP